MVPRPRIGAAGAGVGIGAGIGGGLGLILALLLASDLSLGIVVGAGVGVLMCLFMEVNGTPSSKGGPVMTSVATRLTAAAAVAVGLLAGVGAAIGTFGRGDGSSLLVTSARGETYEMATTGVYANNALALVGEGIGWDVFTLAVAVPAILAGAWLTARGSRRALLFSAGMLGYFAYMYLEYSVTWAFGPLFPLFVVITALTIAGLVAATASISEQSIRFTERFPRRSWAILSAAMAGLLSVLWAERIATGIEAGSTPTLLGETTMTVQALDLGLIVPTSLIIAVAVWRRLPIGFVAGTAFGVTFVAMSSAIAAMMVSSAIVTGVLQLPPILLFGSAGLAGLALVARMFASAESTPRPERGVRAQLAGAAAPGATPLASAAFPRRSSP